MRKKKQESVKAEPEKVMYARRSHNASLFESQLGRMREKWDPAGEIPVYVEEISGGTISVDGRTVNGVAPADRDIAMVFQNYALYPHMTVRENLSFGLRMRKVGRADAREGAGLFYDAKVPLPAAGDSAHVLEILLQFCTVVGAEPHDGALAEMLLDVGQCSIERLLLVHGVSLDDTEVRRVHGSPYGRSCGPAIDAPSYMICSHV